MKLQRDREDYLKTILYLERKKRIHRNYRFVLGFNSALILSGALGLLTSAASALLHNSSTLLLSLHAMTELLPQSENAARLEDDPVRSFPGA